MPHSSTTHTSDTGSHNNSPSASPTQQQIDMFFGEPKEDDDEGLALPPSLEQHFVWLLSTQFGTTL